MPGGSRPRGKRAKPHKGPLCCHLISPGRCLNPDDPSTQHWSVAGKSHTRHRFWDPNPQMLSFWTFILGKAIHRIHTDILEDKMSDKGSSCWAGSQDSTNVPAQTSPQTPHFRPTFLECAPTTLHLEAVYEPGFHYGVVSVVLVMFSWYNEMVVCMVIAQMAFTKGTLHRAGLLAQSPSDFKVQVSALDAESAPTTCPGPSAEPPLGNPPWNASS